MGVTFTAESWTARHINRHPALTASGINRHRVNANRQWHFTRHRVSASASRHGIGQRPRESLDRGVVLRQCPKLEFDKASLAPALSLASFSFSRCHDRPFHGCLW
jgi:hypothetical protein